ncbi:hypothetical protein BJX62DRAFT_237621 [Aspergillus germanicus]
MATAEVSKAALDTLDGALLDPLRQTVLRILSTQRAEYVFAQVADGLPTKDWRSEFNLLSLQVDAGVLQTYKDSRLGTRELRLRLLETTAVVIHTLAALLFMATNQPPYKCSEPRRKFIEVGSRLTPTDGFIPSPFETYLFHNHYRDVDLYPMGVADIVGFWAETHLFDGVVVFDHGKDDTEFRDVYLHPGSGFRVFRLSDTQIDGHVGFGLYRDLAYPFDFPIKAERDAIRLLPELTLETNIYRTRNDRKPVTLPRFWRPRVQRAEDDPFMVEFAEKCAKGELEKGADYN